jgi:hypothetical protein
MTAQQIILEEMTPRHLDAAVELSRQVKGRIVARIGNWSSRSARESSLRTRNALWRPS